MNNIFVLNNAYQCISLTTLSRALTLVKENKAEVVKWDKGFISSTSGLIRIPQIIRIFQFVKAFGRTMRYSNKNVWERDNYTCVYCGKKIIQKLDLQTDHVLPYSKGGRTIFENMVTCCKKCNSKKKDRTPKEAGMSFVNKNYKPFKPTMSRNMSRVIEELKLIQENNL